MSRDRFRSRGAGVAFARASAASIGPGSSKLRASGRWPRHAWNTDPQFPARDTRAAEPRASSSSSYSNTCPEVLGFGRTRDARHSCSRLRIEDPGIAVARSASAPDDSEDTMPARSIEQDERRAVKRLSFRKRRLEGKPLHPSALATRPYDQKTRARRQLQSLIREGWLARPPCSACGTSQNVHAHHHDYSQPLLVSWLCGLCHAAEHRGDLVAPPPIPLLLQKHCRRCHEVRPRNADPTPGPFVCDDCRESDR